MKVLYSQLKKYLPTLEASAREVADAFTMIGYMIDKFHEVEYMGQKDYFLDLEVRQNRPDLLGVIGLAKELSAYWNLRYVTFDYKINDSNINYTLPIEIQATDSVKRVKALKISDVQVGESPKWLVDYLNLYGINSINNLVDITNYVMLETAFPSHAFDVTLSGGDKLIWEKSSIYKSIVTLAGEELELDSNTLLISNGSEPLSLSMIGGKRPAISTNTKEVIVEIGVYDPGLVRRNSRRMKVFTEAGTRLEKHLDPAGIDFAMDMLVNLILQICGGRVSSKIYDNYIKVHSKEDIVVNLDKISQIAGIEIQHKESRNFLTRLGFEIIEFSESKIKVIRPDNRLDIEQEEDVIEEVIRLKGFFNIPTNHLVTEVSKDVTPSHIKLIDRVITILVENGYDEIRSWVLVEAEKNKNANFHDYEEVRVTNSINEEVPIVRQTLAVNLFNQLDAYNKIGVEDIRIFETGKVFGKTTSGYLESNSLGMLINSNKIDDLRMDLEKLLRSIGLENIFYQNIQTDKPRTAHPKSTWKVMIGDQEIGIMYVANKELISNSVVCEINLDLINQILNTNNRYSAAKEVDRKIVTLDANLLLSNDQDIAKEISKRTENIMINLWNWELVDTYVESSDKTKYTLRMFYVGLSDVEAKNLHEKLFL